jgi:lysozyme
MLARRRLLAGFAGLSGLSLAGCGSRSAVPGYAPPGGGGSWAPKVPGLDAVIDISHNVTVSSFRQVREAGMLAVIHKATEGGDWIDPSYASRRAAAEQAGLLWGAYHFGTRQYSGAKQAQSFLATVRPSPRTLLALDYEVNDPNPRNTMTLPQAEEFVRVIQQQTGRLPMVYTHAAWADGEQRGKGGVRSLPILPGSLLTRCDLWLADHLEEPRVPKGWEGRGWKLWQYAADETADKAAYGTVPRAIPGITHCDRNLFNGDTSALYKYWGVGTGRA